jgi:hypothetical protein
MLHDLHWLVPSSSRGPKRPHVVERSWQARLLGRRAAGEPALQGRRMSLGPDRPTDFFKESVPSVRWSDQPCFPLDKGRTRTFALSLSAGGSKRRLSSRWPSVGRTMRRNSAPIAHRRMAHRDSPRPSAQDDTTPIREVLTANRRANDHGPWTPVPSLRAD